MRDSMFPVYLAGVINGLIAGVALGIAIGRTIYGA